MEKECRLRQACQNEADFILHSGRLTVQITYLTLTCLARVELEIRESVPKTA